MAAKRERRNNAGNKMDTLLNDEEEDEFYKTSYGGFQEAEDDNDYVLVSKTIMFFISFSCITPFFIGLAKKMKMKTTLLTQISALTRTTNRCPTTKTIIRNASGKP